MAREYVKGKKHSNQCIWEHNIHTNFGKNRARVGFGIWCGCEQIKLRQAYYAKLGAKRVIELKNKIAKRKLATTIKGEVTNEIN